MPSVTLDLGKYVTLRGPRADGTHRVFFQVPARLRPQDWPSLTPLPFTGVRRGDLTDADEVGRIRADATELYRRLLRGRAGKPVVSERRDLPTLNRSWQSSDHFKAKKPRTQKGYAYHAGLVEDWSASCGHPAVSGITQARIEDFLAVYEDRPTTRRHLKIVLKMLLDRAIDLHWIEKNPAARISITAPETTVTIWEQADVEFYAFAAAAVGQPSIAAMILTEWEIGQRLTDVRLFRWTLKADSPAEYNAAQGVFRFWQSKTRSYVTIPVSDRLRAVLDVVRDDDNPYLFRDGATGKPFAEDRLGHVFADIRMRSAGPHLTIRALRHSCVVQLARAGCTVPEIASITGHKITSVEQILSTYLPRDNQVAWNAQAKRGIVESRDLKNVAG